MVFARLQGPMCDEEDATRHSAPPVALTPHSRVRGLEVTRHSIIQPGEPLYASHLVARLPDNGPSQEPLSGYFAVGDLCHEYEQFHFSSSTEK